MAVEVSNPWKTGVAGRGARRALLAAIGALSMVAQALLFRRFFEVFEGHEAGFAVFYASWLLWVFAGALLARRGGSESALRRSFEWLPLLYLPAILLQSALLARARDWAGVAAYEVFPFLDLLPWAALLNAPVSLLTGALFTWVCALESAGDEQGVARVYGWEAAGGALGGGTATWALAAGAADERVLFAAGFVAAAAGAWSRRRQKRSAMGLAIAAGLSLLALLAGLDSRLQEARHRAAWERRLPGVPYLGAAATPQADYLFGGDARQLVVLAQETIAETLPDEAGAAETLALHLAAAPQARRLLIVGSGGGALARLALRLPQLESVCWTHPDPQLPALLMNRLPEALRPDPARLRLPALDPVAALRDDPTVYDAIILNLPAPSALAANRYWTGEFLRLARSRLSPDGVLGLRITGGETTLGPERVRLGALALATLETVLPLALLKPGEDTWLLGSAAAHGAWTPELLEAAWRARPGAAGIFPPERLPTLLPAERIRFQLDRYRARLAADPPGTWILRADQPRALALGVRLALRHTSPALADVAGRWLDGAFWRRLLAVAAGLALALRLLWLVRRRSRSAHPSPYDAALLVLTTGALSMALSLALLYRYQSRFGELYLHAGLLSALFMLGLAGGGALGRAALRRGEQGWQLPLALAALAAAGGLPAWTLPFGARAVAAATFLLAGIAAGWMVPLAARRFAAAGWTPRRAGAWVEALDHLGGAAGGLLTGLLWLPSLGLTGLPWIFVLLMAVNLPALFTRTGAPLEQPPLPRRERAGRAAALAACGAVVLAFVARATLPPVETAEAPDRSRPDPAMRGLVPESLGDPLKLPGRDSRSAYALLGPAANTLVGYVFRTDAFAAPPAGYGGPLRLAVATDTNGVLRALRLMESRETAAYERRTRPWQQRLVGRNLFDADEWTDVDAVSGATYTSRAILAALRAAGPAFAAELHARPTHATATPRAAAGLAWAWLGLATLALGLRFRSHWLARALFLAVVAGGFGFQLNQQVSLFHVEAWLRGVWPPPALTVTCLLALGVPVLVALFGNLYCGWLCPFGALQELVGWLRPARWRGDPSPRAWRRVRPLKYLLLLAFCVWALTRNGDASIGDPLTGLFDSARPEGLAVLGLTLLALAIPFRRFWCRALCPTGAALALLGSLSPLRRRFPRVQPGRCDLGLERRDDPDCLACDRCRGPRRPGERAAARAAGRWADGLYPLAAALMAVWVIFYARTAAQRGDAAAGMPESGTPALSAAPTPPGPDESGLRRLRELQRQGTLSDREARYYRRSAPRRENPAVQPLENPRR